ncbi:Metallo-dependent phosphatase-like protein [Lineolata rhizophorae]|uniref:Metallo-dependent phosphatase-like protein n=1 Tax=Lineolata rhizophorae TaxID=578093 RepID=A0A6A6NP87_9PEZI|nr:Metallo-dependent phosphatase-like protein [Lineolata rhizophorae]
MLRFKLGLSFWLRRTFNAGRPEEQDAPESSKMESSNLYPSFPPPPPRELLEHRDQYLNVLNERRYAAPYGEKEDAPLYALYRLYENIVLDDNIGIRNEIEAFWWKRWLVKDIPDPKDEDELERYAVLACIPALLVESFNRRIELGLCREGHSIMSQEEREVLAKTPKTLESMPPWASKVPPLVETLYIPHTIEGESQLHSLDDKRSSAWFKEKNILIWHHHIHFRSSARHKKPHQTEETITSSRYSIFRYHTILETAFIQPLILWLVIEIKSHGLPTWRVAVSAGPLLGLQINKRQPTLAQSAAKRIHDRISKLPPPPVNLGSLAIVCISDTHNTRPALPDGDILIHAGDLSQYGTFAEVQTQLDWLNSQPHKQKIVIAGNYDLLLDADFAVTHPDRELDGPGKSRQYLRWGSLVYLQGSTQDFECQGRKFRIYGSPWTPKCGSFAFQYNEISTQADLWKNRIPDDVDIVLTHGPPAAHLDENGKGCVSLLKEVWRVKPKLHVFGHIHAGRRRGRGLGRCPGLL